MISFLLLVIISDYLAVSGSVTKLLMCEGAQLCKQRIASEMGGNGHFDHPVFLPLEKRGL